MRIIIRAIRLRVLTSDGTLGWTTHFAPGMNVIQGGNNRGKTQIVQGLIYALGMERMLRARAHAPLGSALTSEVICRRDGHEVALPVASSWAAVELENEAGQIMTVQRFIKHSAYRPDLVRVWNGPTITNRSLRIRHSDYFLHAARSVQGERGFHALLMAFLSWTLPTVVDYAGQPLLLYPDVIFPFVVVDQQAWVSSGPRKVDRYQIREPVRRSAEFLLKLDGPAARKRREELERELADLQLRWTSIRSSVAGQVSSAGGRIVGVPDRPAGMSGRSSNVTTTDLSAAVLQIVREGEWIAVDDVLQRLQADLAEIENLQGVSARDPSTLHFALYDEITEVREQLNEILAAAALLEQDLAMSEAELAALDRQLDILQEERDRNRDIATLIRLGSEVAVQHLSDHNCPTCRQSLDGVETELGPTLDVGETIALLNAQISTAKAMRSRTDVVVSQSASAYAAMQREIDHLRVRLRALETDAITPEQVPTSGDIARRLTLELRQKEIERARDVFDQNLETLAVLAQRAAEARTELNALPDGLSEADLRVLESVGDRMRLRLRTSGFGSYDPDLVQIDRDSLQPVRQGFDVDTDASASDVVRIKIAYLDSIRRVGQQRGSHPGLLVLDEPRQQDMELEDYEAILRYLAEGVSVEGQVIITSTTSMSHLRSSLEGSSVTFVELGADRLIDWEARPDPMDA